MNDLQPMTSHPQSVIDALQERIDYRFAETDWLLRALTHSSYLNEHPEEKSDNQRLEFLGDAVLDFAVAAWIFVAYPEFQEGEMTRLRAALVREEQLAAFARQLGLGAALRLGRGEEEGGGQARPANLADAFEALMGALYLDGGLAPVQQILLQLIQPVAERIISSAADKDAKSRFQEWAQGTLGVTPRYHIVDETGPDHDKLFVAEITLEQTVVGRGEGHSKQLAEQAAAQAAWEEMSQANRIVTAQPVAAGGGAGEAGEHPGTTG
ncbi:MAG: ribonuclease III [Anaerolineae bacterium]|nr:ribonuclease III [Anaerolineae bacterium]